MRLYGRISASLLGAVLAVASTGAHAQASHTATHTSLANEGLAQTTRTATSTAGETGQQQARKDISSIAQSGRINNRVNSRLDRHYQIEQDATSAIENAQALQSRKKRR